MESNGLTKESWSEGEMSQREEKMWRTRSEMPEWTATELRVCLVCACVCVGVVVRCGGVVCGGV